MEAWVWLAAYLVGFALLQLYLYRHFSEGESSPDGESSPEPGFRRLEQSSARAEATEVPDSDKRQCKHCGTLNAADAPYTYCRECAQPMR